VLLIGTVKSIGFFFFGIIYLNQMIEMAQSVRVKLGTIVTQNVIIRLVEKSVKGFLFCFSC